MIVTAKLKCDSCGKEVKMEACHELDRVDSYSTMSKNKWIEVIIYAGREKWSKNHYCSKECARQGLGGSK